MHNLLSVSSHVVHGAVGNDAIQFPLNLRHWNVDCIHTTNLSNHPGYRQFRGSKSSPELVADLYQGLKEIELKYDAAIVGYVASKEVLETVYDKILLDLPENTVVVVDPVLGDNGNFYVDEAIVPVYEKILKQSGLIDLVTPNQFETEVLTGVKITGWSSLESAMARFFELYAVQNVVITSVALEGSDDIVCVGATRDGARGDGARGAQNVPFTTVKDARIDAVFSGSGDLFLGLLTDRFVKSNGDLPQSLRETVQVVHEVLQLTYDLQVDAKPKRYIGDKRYLPDLSLIESKEYLIESRSTSNDFSAYSL